MTKLTPRQKVRKHPKAPVFIQACRPGDRAMLKTKAGQALIKAVIAKLKSEAAASRNLEGRGKK